MAKNNPDRLVVYDPPPAEGEVLTGWRAPLVVDGHGLAAEVRAVADGDLDAATGPFVKGWAQAYNQGRATLNGEYKPADEQDAYCAPHDDAVARAIAGHPIRNDTERAQVAAAVAEYEGRS